MEEGKRILCFMAYFMMVLASGCTGMLYTMISSPSIKKPSTVPDNKVRLYEDIRHSVTVFGIEIYPHVINDKAIRDYNTSLIVPFEVKPQGMNYGRPFVIDLALRTENEGISYAPLFTEVVLAGNTESVYPEKIIISEDAGMSKPPLYIRVPCLYNKMPATSTILSKGSVTLPSKYSGSNSRKIVKDRWLCVQLQFDIPTPDPSVRFRLKLGEIVMPNGKHVRPTIYFSPEIYKEFQH